MKRSLQEIVELVVFGLIALLLGTGLLWLVGALFGVVGTVLGWLAGVLWALLRFVVPVALVAGLIVWLVRAAQDRGGAATHAPAPATDGPVTELTADDGPTAAPDATPSESAAYDVAAEAEAHDAPTEAARDGAEDAATDDADPDRPQA